MTKTLMIKQIREEFSTDDKCLDEIFRLKLRSKVCPNCKSHDSYTRVKDRRCYQCSKCRNQIYPTKGTPLEKTTTPLTSWFFTMSLFTTSKNGVSAKEIQRFLGVTYKTAWRMLKQIRILMKGNDDFFTDDVVELDETYIGGKNKNRHFNKKVKHTQGRSYKDKVPVFGILGRNGKVNAFVVSNVKSDTLRPIIEDKIRLGTTIMTDEWNSYARLNENYNHNIVQHGKGQYVKGKCHTNGLENFWSIVKRTINGSYIRVSRKYMQLYVNECVFRFNNRNNPDIFRTLISCLSY